MNIFNKEDTGCFSIECHKCHYVVEVIDVFSNLSNIACPICGSRDVGVSNLDATVCQNGL